MEGTGRKCCIGILSNYLNFLNMFWHYYLIGNIQDHFVAIQTSSRHAPDTLQTPRNSPPILVEMGHWEKVEYVEIKIPTQLF